MSAEQFTVMETLPGGVINKAIEDSLRGINLNACALVYEAPVIPEHYQSACSRVAEKAVYKWYDDSKDYDDNVSSFYSGLRIAYSVAHRTTMFKPYVLAFHQFGSEDCGTEQVERLLVDAEVFGQSSPVTGRLAGQLQKLSDPLDQSPVSRYWGIITGLYMLDQGERNRQAYWQKTNAEFWGILRSNLERDRFARIAHENQRLRKRGFSIIAHHAMDDEDARKLFGDTE